MSLEQVLASLSSTNLVNSKMLAEMAQEDSIVSPIEKLNQDCLMSIFSELPIADLARCERVCKSWQEIAKLSWSGFKKLSLTPKGLGLRPVGTKHAIKEINEEVVEQVLIRCGKYLEEINASKIRADFSLLIGEYCKNIQSISCYKVSSTGLEQLTKNCTSIFELKIHNLSNFEDDEEMMNELLGKFF